jgi:VWFA-related protein
MHRLGLAGPPAAPAALAAAVALLTAPLLAAAADAETRSVALVVTDAHGTFVGDVRADELRVLENGEARELVSFARDERPLALVLVLDTSTGAARVFRAEAFDAVSALLSGLPEGTRCTLWTTGERPRRMGVLEGGRAPVEKKVAQAFGLEGPNELLDALSESAESLARESGRRRALVAVSGAGAGHTTLSPGDVSARVRRAGARVLGVLYREGESGGPGSLRGLDVPRDDVNLTIVGSGDHERVLSGLARATGGRFEAVPTTLGVRQILASMGAEIAGQYRLRYAGSDTRGPRQVDVRLARTGVRWRVAVDTP